MSKTVIAITHHYSGSSPRGGYMRKILWLKGNKWTSWLFFRQVQDADWQVTFLIINFKQTPTANPGINTSLHWFRRLQSDRITIACDTSGSNLKGYVSTRLENQQLTIRNYIQDECIKQAQNNLIYGKYNQETRHAKIYQTLITNRILVDVSISERKRTRKFD